MSLINGALEDARVMVCVRDHVEALVLLLVSYSMLVSVMCVSSSPESRVEILVQGGLHGRGRDGVHVQLFELVSSAVSVRALDHILKRVGARLYRV